jgi:F-type H+-transporting ATPase subunit alpha
VNGFLDRVAVRDVTRFETAMLSSARDSLAGVMNDINSTGQLSDDNKSKLNEFLSNFAKNFA